MHRIGRWLSVTVGFPWPVGRPSAHFRRCRGRRCRHSVRTFMTRSASAGSAMKPEDRTVRWRSGTGHGSLDSRRATRSWRRVPPQPTGIDEVDPQIVALGEERQDRPLYGHVRTVREGRAQPPLHLYRQSRCEGSAPADAARHSHMPRPLDVAHEHMGLDVCARRASTRGGRIGGGRWSAQLSGGVPGSAWRSGSVVLNEGSSCDASALGRR